MAPSITLGMIVKNEELLLGQCLESIRSIVDEIIIVDTGSIDNTINIAKRYESSNLNLTQKVLRKYHVSYIVIGDLERARFKKLRENKLVNLGNVVFDSAKTKIIKVN